MPTSFGPSGNARKWLVLGLLLLLVFAVSALGAQVTLPKIPAWYAGLAKPSFNPPAWLFGPVWTILYIMMAVAAWRVWLRPPSASRRAALMGFFIQLAFNAAWSPVFFGLERPRVALAVIIALLASLAMTTVKFFAVDRVAGWMLAPYLAWVAFATALNGAIVTLN